MPRRRASMREGPLAELFRATEAAQRQAEKEGKPAGEPEPEAPVEEAKAAPPPTPVEPPEQTVEHVPEWEEEAVPTPPPPPSEPVRLPERVPEPERVNPGTQHGGQIVTILYRPERPTDVLLDENTAARDITLWLIAVKLLVGGLVFLGVGIRRLRRLPQA